MKVFCVITIGRQVEGEAITVRFEKAFKQASKADAYAKELGKTFTESISNGVELVQFYCERGVHEIEVEE